MITKNSRLLSANGQIGYTMLAKNEAKQRDLCLKLTGGVTLTETEYQNATLEFKELIDIPRGKGEPIYIMPEFDSTGQLHPELKILVDNLQTETPYHLFIGKDYGIVWPKLLRLYYGLDSGFKISMTQLESMLGVCYWSNTGLTTESCEFFNNHNQLTELGDLLINSLMPFTGETQKNNFIRAINHPTIPLAEKSFKKIILSPAYILFVRESKNTPEIESLITRLGIAAQPTVGSMMVQTAVGLFGTLITLQHWTCKVIIHGDQAILLLPSQTMTKIYIDTINPTLNLAYKSRLGMITPALIEYHSERHQRVGNLFAPGITNPKIIHRCVSQAAFIFEHDLTHFYQLGTQSPDISKQMLQTRRLLRQLYVQKQGFTSEIMRSLECESPNVFSDNDRFIMLMYYIFTKNLSVKNASLTHSSVIPLIDMILHPLDWPSYVAHKIEIIRFLLVIKINTSVGEIEAAVKQYDDIAKKNYHIIAVLLICRFSLHDLDLCQGLISSYPSDEIAVLWQKNADKQLEPIMKRNKTIYTLEQIEKMAPEDRFMLARTKYYVPQQYQTKKESAIETIKETKGQFITNSSGQIEAILIFYKLLTRSIRDKLGLDRIKVADFKKEQKQYVRRHIPQIVIEPILDKPSQYYCTFAKSKRLDVERVVNNWEEIRKEAATKIQAFYRNSHAKNFLTFRVKKVSDTRADENICDEKINRDAATSALEGPVNL